MNAEQKVQVNQERLKSLRGDKGLSIAGLEAAINDLYTQGRVKRKIGKSVLHRIETSDGKEVPFSQIQIIAFALDVQADSLTLSEFQQVRKIDLFKVTEGKELSNMAQATSNYRFRLDDEPGSVEAQEAVINLLKLLDEKGHRRNMIEATQYNFDIRRIIDTLQYNGFAIFAEVSKQVAPFTIDHIEEDGEADASFTLFNKPFKKSDDYYSWFEGIGICDVLLISVSKDAGSFLETEHDMDPANLIGDYEDPYLIENLQRICDGREEIEWSEIDELPLEEFASDHARKITIRKREDRAKQDKDKKDLASKNANKKDGKT